MAIVSTPNFLQATRDSGYKSTSFALAELIDNSLEAGATHVQIVIEETSIEENHSFDIYVQDNGEGMDNTALATALRFGGTTRFNSRIGSGRYGMGLPNSSLSQARRADVFSWIDPDQVWWSYLDIDELINTGASDLPTPVPIPPSKLKIKWSKSGTLVKWSKCDRIGFKKLPTLLSHLRYDLGRMYRHFLWEGKKIIINGVSLESHDPLFLSSHRGIEGATLFGGTLSYTIKVSLPGSSHEESQVNIRISELPVEKWASMSNEEKNSKGIAKGAGVSIVRGKREITSGWFFMGNKRKENYDDWWRCEIQFEPHLDELFGITHTKQTIRPLPLLNDILSSDLEKISKTLNARVRQQFLSLKEEQELTSPKSALIAQQNETSINPIKVIPTRKYLNNLAYKLRAAPLDTSSFFQPAIKRGKLTVTLNEDHPFFQSVYQPLLQLDTAESRFFKQHLELLLFASARCELGDVSEMDYSVRFRERWSDTLAAFLR